MIFSYRDRIRVKMKRRSLRELVRYVERCRWGEPRKNDVGEFGRQCLPNLMGAAAPKKKMVPSDPIPSLARRGHATAPNIAFRSAVRYRWFAPRMPVFAASASTRPNTLQLPSP
jgi:hypothetical protein